MKLLLALLAVRVVVYGKSGWGPGEQDWGYVTVRPKAHMFWWFYETTANVTSITSRPLVIWLQGGPGSSSMAYGNIYEIGPVDGLLQLRNYTWVKDANLLFIDSPVGAGFSYVEELSALATNGREIVDDLLVCLKGFYDQHPEFRNVPLYIVGESYGGKMAVEFALKLHKEVKNGTMQANLLGLSLIDSWISPMLACEIYSKYLYYLGIVDVHGRDKIAEDVERIRVAISNGWYEKATEYFLATEATIFEVTNNIDFYNILTKVPPRDNRKTIKTAEDIYNEQILNTQVREALNLPVHASIFNETVFNYLRKDFMRAVVDEVDEILYQTDIKVQVVTGQLDLIVPTTGTMLWVNELRWAKIKKWESIRTEPLVIDKFVEGYRKSFEKLSYFVVLRAGHMGPHDNPKVLNHILCELIN